MDTGKKGKVSRMNREIRTDIYTLPCTKYIGSSVQCSVMTQRGGDAGVGGRAQREGAYVYI